MSLCYCWLQITSPQSHYKQFIGTWEYCWCFLKPSFFHFQGCQILFNFKQRAPKIDVNSPGTVQTVSKVPIPVLLWRGEKLLERSRKSEASRGLKLVTHVNDHNKEPLKKKHDSLSGFQNYISDKMLPVFAKLWQYNNGLLKKRKNKKVKKLLIFFRYFDHLQWSKSKKLVRH